MNKQSAFPRIFLGLGLALVLAAAPVLTGCNSNENGTSILDPSSSTGTLAMTPPTLAEVQSAAGLTREEASRVEPALNQWRQQAGTQKQFRRGDGPGDRPDSPMFTFLAQASKSLTAQQFADVVNLLAERRDQFREQMHAEHQARFQKGERPDPGEGMGPGEGFGMQRGDGPGMHRGDGPGMHRGDGPGMQRGDRRQGPGSGFFEDLNLTEDQRAPFRDAMRTAHTTMRDAGKAFANGEITREQVRDRAQAAVDALRASLQSILSTEQYQLLLQNMAEHRNQMIERRLEHMGEGIDRRVEHLTELLNLEDTQVTAITQVLQDSFSQLEALFDQVKAGSIGFADALYQGIQLHDQTRDRIRDQLTPDQQVKFDALQKLQRGPRWMRLYL